MSDSTSSLLTEDQERGVLPLGIASKNLASLVRVASLTPNFVVTPNSKLTNVSFEEIVQVFRSEEEAILSLKEKNHQLSDFHKLPCVTPLTLETIGYLYFDKTNIEKDTLISSGDKEDDQTKSDEGNCIMIPDLFHNWMLHIYTCQPISKGMPFVLSTNQNPSTIFPLPLSLRYQKIIQDNFVLTNPNEINHFGLTDSLFDYIWKRKLWHDSEDVNLSKKEHNLNWRTFLLLYSLNIILQKDHITITTQDKNVNLNHMLLYFKKYFAFQQNPLPLITTCLLTESLYHKEKNKNWYTCFLPKLLSLDL